MANSKQPTVYNDLTFDGRKGLTNGLKKNLFTGISATKVAATTGAKYILISMQVPGSARPTANS